MSSFTKPTCLLCHQSVTEKNFQPTDVTRDVLEVLRLNISSTRDPIVCKRCLNSLGTHNSFVENCLNLEQKVNISHIKVEEIDIKLEEDEPEEKIFIKIESIDIKSDTDEQDRNATHPHTYTADGDNLSKEDYSEAQLSKSVPCDTKREYDIEARQTKNHDPNRHQDELCNCDTIPKGNLVCHNLTDESHAEMGIYKRARCSYEAKHKCCLKRHLLVHAETSSLKMHKCTFCAYENKRKCLLKVHMLKHQDPSEIETFKCTPCNSETKNKHQFAQHMMLVHGDLKLLDTRIPSLKLHKCTVCDFATKWTTVLKRHMIKHQDPTKVERVTCPQCNYVLKHKNYLKNHMLVHEDPSSLKIHKCTLCNYKAKRKCYLKPHMIKHHASVVKLHRCGFCKFKTKWKKSLDVHMLKHEVPF